MSRATRWTAGALMVGAALMLASCASVRFMEDLDDYEAAIERLQQEAARNPNDAEPLRDLGIIYLRTNSFAQANEFLQQAFSRDPDDAKTLFHLGLVNEALGKQASALPLYARYQEFSVVNPYRRLMAGRYAHVVRKTAQAAVQASVADEARLMGQAVSPGVVAVYPMVYQGSDAQYAVLGRGLAELMTIDLGQVDQIRLVERVRLQELLDEINVAGSEHFDAGTAPRVGHLVGAGRLVGGVYDVLEGRDLQLSAAMWQTEQATVADLGNRSSALSNLIQMEKEVVFRVLEEMGIEVTEEQRRRIEFIPTQNLQAFLAFSRGLEREDAGAFDEAAGFYQQALTLDPNFRLARDRADEAQGQVAVAGPISAGLTAAYGQDPSPPRPGLPGADPMTVRLQTLTTAIGSYVVPGIDAREPPAEAGSTGVLREVLPDPPPPPPRDGGKQ